MPDKREALTIAEAVEQFRVSPSLLRSAVQRRALRPQRFLGRLLLDPNDLAAFLRARAR
jgi:hypothetical protein